MIIAVDFDGTLCENRWPAIGAPNKKLIERLIEMKWDGHKIILWTMRTHEPIPKTEGERDLLQEAIDFCEDNGLIFDAVNAPDPDNAKQFGDNSRKIYADIYIDDHNAAGAFMDQNLIPFVRNLEAQDMIKRQD